MVPFFVQIKCQLGKSYEVANKLADAEIASEIYSTAGDFDLLVKFYVDPGDRHRPFHRRESTDHSRHRRYPHHPDLQGVRGVIAPPAIATAISVSRLCANAS